MCRICRKHLREKTSACISLFVFFIIRRDTLPYSGRDDAYTTKSNINNHARWVQYTKEIITETHPKKRGRHKLEGEGQQEIWLFGFGEAFERTADDKNARDETRPHSRRALHFFCLNTG